MMYQCIVRWDRPHVFKLNCVCTLYHTIIIVNIGTELHLCINIHITKSLGLNCCTFKDCIVITRHRIGHFTNILEGPLASGTTGHREEQLERRKGTYSYIRGTEH